MKVFATTTAAAALATLALSTQAADVNVIGAHRDPAAAITVASDPAARVNVVGAQSPSMMTMDANTDPRPSLRIATKDILNRPTALLNKNTLAMDNNIYITRSNIVFTQNDRLAMREKVRQELYREQAGASSMTTATLTTNVLRAVSAPQTDDVLMTKASAVVAAKGSGDQAALAARIADLVDSAAMMSVKREQSIQSDAPRGIVVLLGTKDILRQPTAIVNKNVASTDNQAIIRNTNISPTSNDVVTLTGASKVADAVLPASAVKVGHIKSETETETETESETDKADKTEAAGETEPQQYRVAFMYPKSGGNNKEQWGLWGGGIGLGLGVGSGWGLGWRYPLGYWNTIGAGLYGIGGCGLGIPMGGFFYC
ncbi:hypothetical protein PINS_up012110 [Pythium insidiosum]|nr:hypothetical protein PINS_up012110 [Pythium insidiosum]